MSNDTYYIPSAALGRLKERARKLKRERRIPHTKALDHIAQEIGLPHWKALMDHRRTSAPIEETLQTGALVLYDPSECDDFKEGQSPFVEVPFELVQTTQDDLLEWARESSEDLDIDPSGRPLKHLYSDEQILADLYERLSGSRLFYISSQRRVASATDVLEMACREFFFGPLFIWFRGTLYDPEKLASGFTPDRTAAFR